MTLRHYLLHSLHCVVFISVFYIMFCTYTENRFWSYYFEGLRSNVSLGALPTILLYIFQLAPLLAIPHHLFNNLGVLFYSAFPDEPKLNKSPCLAPFICVRTVTRGDYPLLVKYNVIRNIKTCVDVGLENFVVEVVTDKPLDLPQNSRIREVVVPPSYRTKRGTIFKARALQYCLEDDVNVLKDDDWIVHLDEETLLTPISVKGILNFVFDGKHAFGQGVITYANEKIVNWVTTFADSFRVAEDYGRIRFQFRMFNLPLFGWKGSYMVSQAGAERRVTFDNGLDGSILEDFYFSMMAYKNGYTFNFIEGDMWEKSPFTLLDFVKQRKRWLQGAYLVVRSRDIPVRLKIFIITRFSASVIMPFGFLSLIFSFVYSVPVLLVSKLCFAFASSSVPYWFLFGFLKSFSLHKLGVFKYLACLVGLFVCAPIYLAMDLTATTWGVIGNKHGFYVVKKQVEQNCVNGNKVCNNKREM